MKDSKYLQTKAEMHIFSRSPLAKGQTMLDQATSPAGHAVSAKNVRAEDIPFIATIEERDSKYLEDKHGVRIVGGELGATFASTIKFIDKASIREIPGTNGEAYIVVDYMNNAYKNFISPSDEPFNYCTLAEGYAIQLIGSDGTVIPQDFGWTFDYFNGVIHFNPESKPSSPNWGFGVPKVEAFVYVGKFVSEYVQNANETQTELVDNVQNMLNGTIALQQFKFSSVNMTTVGEPYVVAIGTQTELYQRLSMIIPAYVFELIRLDKDETILTDIRHLQSGDSQIFFDVPWDAENQCPIIGYDYDSGQDGIGHRIAARIGEYKFIATGFVSSDGNKITMRPMVDYEDENNEVIPPPFDYINPYPYDPGISTASLHPTAPFGAPPPINNNNTIVNVNY